MKKGVGIASIIIGAFFFIKIIGWNDPGTIMAQTLFWCVGGFGVSFILFGLFAIGSSIQDAKRESEAYQTFELLNSLKEDEFANHRPKAALKPKPIVRNTENISTEPIFKDAEEPMPYKQEKPGDDFEPWKI